ncbi:hypothetical protein J4411_04035 [Candidatus Pacearchaeota archaeon]|nr:hypothetical protein [Candidatus Pacearchaeota archaeon]
MEIDEINSVKDVIKLIEENMEKLKGAMKTGNEENFSDIKRSLLDLSKEIEEIINKKEEVKSEKMKNEK